ncbi:MAG: type II secretion system protein GspM [Methylotenera sp.]
MKHWLSICSKFEALNQRERWMVTCALFVVVFAVINILLLNPVLARQKTLNDELATDQAQINALNQQINALAHSPIIDPDAQNKQRMAELHSRLALLDTKLIDLQTSLIRPDKMPDLLHNLLKKNGKLKLIELQTLPVKGLLESATEDKEQTSKQELPVYKHGVEITIEGRYLDLLDYVANLEKMPWHVLWSKAALNAEHYPDNQLKLTVYTLSLDRTWLSI